MAECRPGSVGVVREEEPAREPTSEDHRPVAAAVIVEDGRVLLILRRVTEGRLSWQFPAGKVEPGESAGRAAVREALEETGLAVRSVGSLGARIHPDTGRTMLYVACEVVRGTPFIAAKEEVAEVARCDHTTLAAYVAYPLYGPVEDYLDDNLVTAG
jgi:8-oxo-dGTP pyrophosphatase MutT (NUDIX family)